ncbi:MAG: Succinate dehydrogenase/fumarate reductase, flavoprotein subunit [Firmicutes bacterium]|nr:Succinate dehydrogenase/fumarate reductase, flavoprotein subunit [Bacillota bacterium]
MECKTQIAIIGGGASGMSAAVAAAEAGAAVVVIEANAVVGGNGLFPRGIFGVDSYVQRRKLIFADTDEVFTNCMEYSHWKLDGKLVRTLIDKSGDTIGWLEKKGVKFTDVVHHIPNQTPEVFHITATELNAGKAIIEALDTYCEKSGVKILTETRAKNLLFNGNGIINGVLCESKDGETVKIEAEKVIICTGGFAGNPELISEYYPKFDPYQVAQGAGMRHKGNGINMALEAGASIEGNFAMEIAAPKIKGYTPLNLLIGKPHNIWVNSLGKRFTNEEIVYDFTMATNACIRQPGAAVWVLFDRAMIEKTLSDGRDIIELIHIPLDAENHLEKTISEAIKGGILKVSDNLSDIAEFIGCCSDSLKNTVEEYNSFCDKNRDPIFAKKRRYLSILTNPPYYAVKAGPDMIITHGGIRVNERFEALTDRLETVPNLYVAGVDFGGADADVYNVSMSGHGFGFAVNSGRMAGENSAKSVLDMA